MLAFRCSVDPESGGELKLWDLGHPVKGLRARPKLIAKKMNMPSRATLWSLECSGDRLRVVSADDVENGVVTLRTHT